jgi:hypothetical protein
MSYQAILAPVFAMVLLTFVLLIMTAVARRADVKSGRVRPADIALGQLAWPVQTQQYGNSFNNQFQLPMLFYVVMIVALVTRQADILFVVLAWLFVALRVVHAGIHVTHNRVMRRGLVFGIGGLVLMVMWIILAIRVLLAV